MSHRLSLLFTALLVPSMAMAGDRVATPLENGVLYQIVEPAQVHRLDQPAFVSVALAGSFMGEFEPIVGVVEGDAARAYPAWFLDGYSVVNDKIGRMPIVVTWSPFSFSSMVWNRVVEGDTLEFDDSGELWKDALIMVDRKTHSRWSHLEGRALDGPLKGKKLKGVLNTYTSWGKWRSLYPETVCLTKLGRDISASDFSNYYDREEQLGPANSQNPDSRMVGKELVCGFEINGQKVAVPLYVLVERKQFKLEVDGVPLEIEFDHLAETAVVYKRDRAGQPMDLVRLDFGSGESYLKDKTSGTMWLTYSGRGVSGPLANTSLERVPSTLCFWFVWAAHYPLSLIWEEPGSSPRP
jgi:uncharacterized protein DUF3179